MCRLQGTDSCTSQRNTLFFAMGRCKKISEFVFMSEIGVFVVRTVHCEITGWGCLSPLRLAPKFICSKKSPNKRSRILVRMKGFSRRLANCPQDSLPRRCGAVALFKSSSPQDQTKSPEPKFGASVWCSCGEPKRTFLHPVRMLQNPRIRKNLPDFREILPRRWECLSAAVLLSGQR